MAYRRLTLNLKSDENNLMSVAAVFDAGKTRWKLSLVSASGKIVSSRSSPARGRGATSEWPWLSIDTGSAETFLIRALLAARREEAVDYFVPVGHGAAAVWIDGEGPAAPPVDYEARVPEEVAAAYDNVRPPFTETGSPALARGLNLGRQIYWASLVNPLLATQARLVPWPQYWAWRLSGVAASEISSLGCHTDLWSAADSSWSSLARSMGWNSSFAPLRGAGEVLGGASGPAAEAAGLNERVNVICGAHDSNAAMHAVRHSSAGANAALVSTGTWFIAMAPAAATPLDEGRDCLINIGTNGEPIPTARFMGGREHGLIAADGGEATRDDVAALVRSGSMVMPPVVPLGGPFAGRAGGFVGEAPRSAAGKAALAAAYTALMTNYCLDLIGATGAVVIEGPFVKDAAGLGLLAALRSGPVLASSVDLVAIGAATMAFGASAVDGLQFDTVVPWAIHGWRDYAREWRVRAEAQPAGYAESKGER